MTLPLIRALAVGTPAEAALIRARDRGRRRTDFAPVMAVLERTGALAYARSRAERRAGRSATLTALPASPYKENLLELVSFAARRTY